MLHPRRFAPAAVFLMALGAVAVWGQARNTAQLYGRVTDQQGGGGCRRQCGTVSLVIGEVTTTVGRKLTDLAFLVPGVQFACGVAGGNGDGAKTPVAARYFSVNGSRQSRFLSPTGWNNQIPQSQLSPTAQNLVKFAPVPGPIEAYLILNVEGPGVADSRTRKSQPAAAGPAACQVGYYGRDAVPVDLNPSHVRERRIHLQQGRPAAAGGERGALRHPVLIDVVSGSAEAIDKPDASDVFPNFARARQRDGHCRRRLL